VSIAAHNRNRSYRRSAWLPTARHTRGLQKGMPNTHPRAESGVGRSRERRQEGRQLQLHRPLRRRLPSIHPVTLAMLHVPGMLTGVSTLTTQHTPSRQGAAAFPSTLLPASGCMLLAEVSAKAWTRMLAVSMSEPALFAAAAAAASSSGWTGPPTASCGSNGWSGRSASGNPCTQAPHQPHQPQYTSPQPGNAGVGSFQGDRQAQSRMLTRVQRGTSGGSPSAAAPLATPACMAGGIAAAAIALAARQCLHWLFCCVMKHDTIDASCSCNNYTQARICMAVCSVRQCADLPRNRGTEMTSASRAATRSRRQCGEADSACGWSHLVTDVYRTDANAVTTSLAPRKAGNRRRNRRGSEIVPAPPAAFG